MFGGRINFPVKGSSDVSHRMPRELHNLISTHDLLKTEDHYFLTATGELKDHIVGSRIGSRNNVPSTDFIILTNIDVVQPTANTAMIIVSSNTGDSASGTGIQQITIDYFNQSWIKKSETVILNGITQITTANTDIFRIDRIHANKVGVNANADGTITFKSPDNTLLYAQLDAGTAIFERAIVYVPTGYMCIISDVKIGSYSGETIFRIFMTEEDANGNLVPIGQDSAELSSTIISQAFKLPIVVKNPNGKRIAMGIAVKSRQGTPAVTGSFRFHLMML